MMLSYFFYLLVLSFLFFVNFGFFFLSEELLVFSSSLFFVFLAFLFLRASARGYFFLRAYHVYICFLYGLLASAKAFRSIHLAIESLVANLFLLVERDSLGQQTVVHIFLISVKLGETFFLRRVPTPLFDVSPGFPFYSIAFSYKSSFQRKIFFRPCELF